MKPIRLQARMKKKMLKTNGKNRIPEFARGGPHHAGDELVTDLGP